MTETLPVVEDNDWKTFVKIFCVGSLILIFLLIVVSQVWGINKNDYVKLVSNTDDCLTDCETVYEIYGYQAPVKIDVIDSFWKFRTKKDATLRDGGSVPELKSYSFFVNQTSIIPRTCPVNVPYQCNQQANLSWQSCDNITSYNCDATVETWRPFAPYDKSIVIGEKVKLKIKGFKNKTSDIDNVLNLKINGTFYNYDEYAWWNTTFTKCRTLDITNSAQVVNVSINASDFTNINNSNGAHAQLRIVNGSCTNSGSELYWWTEDVYWNSTGFNQLWINVSNSTQISLNYDASGIVANTSFFDLTEVSTCSDEFNRANSATVGSSSCGNTYTETEGGSGSGAIDGNTLRVIQGNAAAVQIRGAVPSIMNYNFISRTNWSTPSDAGDTNIFNRGSDDVFKFIIGTGSDVAASSTYWQPKVGQPILTSNVVANQYYRWNIFVNATSFADVYKDSVLNIGASLLERANLGTTSVEFGGQNGNSNTPVMNVDYWAIFPSGAIRPNMTLGAVETNVVANARPYITNVTIYNISTVLGGKVQFDVYANDTDGQNDVERVNVEISNTGINLSASNIGSNKYQVNYTIPYNMTEGNYTMNVSVWDGNLSAGIFVSSQQLSVNNSRVLSFASQQNNWAGILRNSSVSHLSYFRQVVFSNRNFVNQSYAINTTLPANYVNSSVAITDISGTAQSFTINNSGFASWSYNMPANSNTQFNVSYNLSVLSASDLRSNCTGTDSKGSCTVSFNITSNHSKKLDNVVLKLGNENLVHWSSLSGNLRVGYKLLSGNGAGDFDQETFLSLTANTTLQAFSTYSWQNASGCQGFCVGEASGGETITSYNLNLANVSNSTIGLGAGVTSGDQDVTGSAVFGSVSITQDFGASSTYEFKVDYDYDTSQSLSPSQAHGGESGGGGGASVVTVGGFSFIPKSIDVFVLKVPLVNKDLWSYDFVPNRKVYDCKPSEGFVCAISSDGLKVSVSRPMKEINGVVVGSLVLTDIDGNVFTIPMTLRSFDLNYAIDTKDLNVPDALKSELFFRLNDGGIVTGIKIWWIALLIGGLSFGLFKGLK